VRSALDPSAPRRRFARLLLALLVVAGLTACGGGVAKHQLGERVTVTHTQTTGGENAPTTTLAVTVLDVSRGEQGDLDLAGLEVDPDDTSKTPYYVTTRFENQGTATTERLLYVALENENGESIAPINVFDIGLRFEKCPGTTFGELAPGESIEICSTFFVPEGSEPARIGFLPHDPASETEYVYWEID
jgi:hypothetical protein